MIERIIENWLDKATETTFQLPFCYMLANEGYTIIHLTRHCGMEHGKDILAIAPDGTACAYQLKAASKSRIKLNEWQSGIQGQITQLVFTPINHPSIKSNDYHKSFLVTNGGIEEEVFSAIATFNNHWANNSKPEFHINTIVKGQLLEMAQKLKTDFIPTEVEDFKSLLEFYLDQGKGILNKQKFSQLLDSVFLKENLSKNETKRIASSAALLCSLATFNYTNNNNHIAIIEAWTIYSASLMRFCEVNSIRKNEFQNEFDIAQSIIINSAENLLLEDGPQVDFLIGNPAYDTFVVKPRITWVIGLVCSLGIYYKLKDPENENLQAIIEFCNQNAKYLEMYGESALPIFLSYYWFTRLNNEKEKAIEIISKLLYSITGIIDDTQMIFPDIYYGIDEAVSLRFETNQKILEPHLAKRHSYILEGLVSLLVRENQKEVLRELWPSISYNYFVDFEFEKPQDFYNWNNTTGKQIDVTPNSTQAWKELVTQSESFNENLLPVLLKEALPLIPFFLIVFPQRTNKEVVKWLDSKLFDRSASLS